MLFAGKQKKENFWDGPMIQTHFLVEVYVHSINPKDFFFFLTKKNKKPKVSLAYIYTRRQSTLDILYMYISI